MRTCAWSGWDLPGHGRGGPAEAFTIAELAAGVLALADGFAPETFHYAGDSVGGCVGLQLLLDAPYRLASATLLCTGAVIGTPDGWRERAATVRVSGNWGTRGRRRRNAGSPPTCRSVSRASARRYSMCCVTPTRSPTRRPVRHWPGSTSPTDFRRSALPSWRSRAREDIATPPEYLQRIASGVKDGRLVVLDSVGHLAPAEAPDRVAQLIAEHAASDGAVSGDHR